MLRALLGILLAACAGVLTWLALSAGTPRAELTVAVDQIRTIDPHRVSWADEIQIAQALFEGLTRLNPDTLEPEPACAERWERSADGREYTFFLRSEARWSNGEPVTADDFCFSWLRVLDPKVESQYAALLFVLQGGEAYYLSRLNDDPADDAPGQTVGVHAADARTLRVQLTAPCPYFLDLTSFPTLAPVHPPTVRRLTCRDGQVRRGTTRLWTRPEHFIGNGPFVLKSWEFKHRLWLERNAGYWDAQSIALRSLEFFITSPAAGLLSYQTGRVDLVRGLDPEIVAALRAAQERGERRDVHVGDRFATYFVRVNCRRPPLDDARIRQALSLGVDREALCAHVTGMGETPAYTYVPRGALPLLCRERDGLPAVCYEPPGGLGASLSRDQRLARARALLAECGYDLATARPIELAFAPEPVQQRRVAEALQAMWAQNLGLRVELRVNERHYLSTRIRELDYDLARSDWYGDYMDPTTFLDMFHSASGQNRTGWSNAAYDGLLAAAAHETDDARRYALLAEAERILCEQELPIVPLYFKRGNFLLNPQVQGLRDNIRDFLPVHRARRIRPAERR